MTAFPILVLRLNFRARQTVWFEPWKAGNYFRGKLGITARRLCCPADCPGASSCPNASKCHYARLFEPSPIIAGPSGFANLPRPFVLRAEDLNGRTFQPGEPFSMRLHLLGAWETAPLIDKAFGALEQLELLGIESTPVEIPLAAEAASFVDVEFLTPMEIKWKDTVIRQPDFPALISRLRDRIASITSFYDGKALAWDFKQMAERAETVRMTSCEVRPVDSRRRSSRTGQTHGLGGFIGHARYEGDLGEYIPLLRVAEWIGIGRHTSWGNGAIRISTRRLP